MQASATLFVADKQLLKEEVFKNNPLYAMKG
jgi:hypothetical protein